MEKPEASDFGHPGPVLTHWTSLGCSNVDPHRESTTCGGCRQVDRKTMPKRRTLEFRNSQATGLQYFRREHRQTVDRPHERPAFGKTACDRRRRRME